MASKQRRRVEDVFILLSPVVNWESETRKDVHSQEIINQLSHFSKQDKNKLCQERNAQDESVLTLAIERDFRSVVNFLLINFPVALNEAASSTELLPLHLTCKSETGDADLITALIEGGADCKIRSPSGVAPGRTPLSHTPAWYSICADNITALTALLKHDTTCFHKTQDLLHVAIIRTAVHCFEHLVSTRSLDETDYSEILYEASLKGMRFVRPLLKAGYRFTADFTRKHPRILHEFYARNHVLRGETVECGCAEFTGAVLATRANARQLTVDPFLIHKLLVRIIKVRKSPVKWSSSTVKAFYSDLESTLELLAYRYPTLLATHPRTLLEECIDDMFKDVQIIEDLTIESLILTLSLLATMMKQGTRITEEVLRLLADACRRSSLDDRKDEESVYQLGHLICHVLHLSVLQQKHRYRSLHFFQMINSAAMIKFRQTSDSRYSGLSAFSEAVLQEIGYLLCAHPVAIQYAVNPDRPSLKYRTFLQAFTNDMCQHIGEIYDKNKSVLQVLEMYVVFICGATELELEVDNHHGTHHDYPIVDIQELIYRSCTSDRGHPDQHDVTTKMLVLCVLYMVDQLPPHSRYRYVHGLWTTLNMRNDFIFPPYRENLSSLSREMLDNWEITSSLKSLCGINIRSCLMSADPVIPLSADSYSSFNGNPDRDAHNTALLNAKLEKATRGLSLKTKQLPLPKNIQNLIIGQHTAKEVVMEMRILCN